MENAKDGVLSRWGLILNLSYEEAQSRLAGCWDWLNQNPEAKKIVDELFAASNPEALVKSRPEDAPPNAKSLEEIVSVGLLVLKKSSEGVDPVSLALEWDIRDPRGSLQYQSTLNELVSRFISPAFSYISRKLENSDRRISEFEGKTSHQYPLEITLSLEKFIEDHPECRRNAFTMMQFGKTTLHDQAVGAIRETLSKYAIEGLRADDKEYHEDLFPNVLTYIYGCSFGIAVFERLETEYFNPNVSLEVGYMRALGKPICLLKDKTLQTLQTDLVGKLYKSFDPQNPKESIPKQLESWLRDKDIITS